MEVDARFLGRTFSGNRSQTPHTIAFAPFTIRSRAAFAFYLSFRELAMWSHDSPAFLFHSASELAVSVDAVERDEVD